MFIVYLYIYLLFVYCLIYRYNAYINTKYKVVHVIMSSCRRKSASHYDSKHAGKNVREHVRKHRRTHVCKHVHNQLSPYARNVS